MTEAVQTALVAAGGAFVIKLLDVICNILTRKKDRLSAIEAKLDKHILADDERGAVDQRYRILRFSDELQHGTLHTKEHFDQVLEDITKYNKYCEEHPDFPNQKTVHATSNINDVYKKCLANKSFL